MQEEARILVVDDDEPIRMLMVRILRRRGYNTDTARNGKEAIEAMQRCRYAVALIDLMMPVQSGWEVLDWLETVPAPDRPLVIVLTAGSTFRTMKPEIVAGTLRKPFDIELLADAVTGCAQAQKHAQRESCPPAETASDEAPPGDQNLN